MSATNESGRVSATNESERVSAMIEILDSLNDPAGKGGGDDRLGFDEGAGRAWVVDGATDVGDVRLFDFGASDAAVYAEALSARLIEGPREGAAIADDFADVIADVRRRLAARSRVGFDAAPRDCLPTAAAMWLRRRGAVADLAWLGDCVALVETTQGVVVYGETDKIDRETEEAARYHAAPDPAARRAALQADRRRANVEGGYWIFGVEPTAADHIATAEIDARPGGRVLLATDGFYRLVEPYALFSPDTLMATAKADGLGALVSAMRERERAPDGAARGRVKASDDAAAILLRFA